MAVKSHKLESLTQHRFAGVSLAGGKTDKTAVAVLDYYPEHGKLFLTGLHEKIKSEGVISADQQLHDILTEYETDLTLVGFDVPLTLPKCLRCDLRCPGFERCKQPEIKWMWERYHKLAKSKRPVKLFTPYTERCAEMYVSSELEEPFYPSHALGANAAPLVARAHYITRRLKIPLVEVFPRLSVWRIGRSLKIQKSYLRFHKHSIEGDECRHFILKCLVNEGIAFIYQQDMRTMVENNHAFEAFISALTSYLKFRGQVEKAPAGYPRAEGWIEIPKEQISWF